MIYLFRTLFGRLALILSAEAFTAWILIRIASSAWKNDASSIGMVITIFVMFLTVFVYQERKLGSNVTWLTTLPLAKRHVWFLNYFVRMTAVLFSFFLLVCISAFLQPLKYGDEPTPFLVHFFGALWESMLSWVAAFGFNVGAPENQILSETMLFVTIFSCCHLYSGVLRFVSGQGRILNIVMFFGAGWAGFLLLAVGNSSVFTFEAFMMFMAALFMLFSGIRTLQMPIRASWPIGLFILFGWGLLIGPQINRAWQGLKRPDTIDEFVDSARYFGKTLTISDDMYRNAFQKPGSEWKIRDLANRYLGLDSWEKDPVLPAESDPVFDFNKSIRAQNEIESAVAVLNLVKTETLTHKHLWEFTKHIEYLDSVSNRPALEMTGAIASLVTISLPEDLLTAWLNSKSYHLRIAAIVYPRFKPYEGSLGQMVNYYRTKLDRQNREERDAVRTTLSVLRGAWLEQGELDQISDQSLFNQQVNRKVCTDTYSQMICNTNYTCNEGPQPELDSCFIKLGINLATLNACLYEFSLKSGVYPRTGLLDAGWIYPGKSHYGVIAGIVCDR